MSALSNKQPNNEGRVGKEPPQNETVPKKFFFPKDQVKWIKNKKRKTNFEESMVRWYTKLRALREGRVFQRAFGIEKKHLFDVMLRLTAFYLASIGSSVRCLGGHVEMFVFDAEKTEYALKEYFLDEFVRK